MIFAGTGVLLQVCIFSPFYGLSELDMDVRQAAKDVIAAQDALIEIFERIENFFKRLERYTDSRRFDQVLP